MRGNPYIRTTYRAQTEQRSIPACAGKPRASNSSAQARAVYPRVCGETASQAAAQVGKGGLSPRVRGNHPRARDGVSYDRSIPACAGKPTSVGISPFRIAVYPRVCGETPFGEDYTEAGGGLSPRVRGNLNGKG